MKSRREVSSANSETRMRGSGQQALTAVALPEMTMAGTSPAIVRFKRLFRASALHQHRSGALRALAFAHDAEALGDFGIGFQQAAEIAAEAVLVELVVGLDVPQPAAVGRNLVSHHDAHDIVFPQPAGFHLEIHQTDTDAEEQA